MEYQNKRLQTISYLTVKILRDLQKTVVSVSQHVLYITTRAAARQEASKDIKSMLKKGSKERKDLYIALLQLTSRCLRNTVTDLRLPKKNSKTGQKCFSFRGAQPLC